jgi:hypothetical protein
MIHAERAASRSRVRKIGGKVEGKYVERVRKSFEAATVIEPKCGCIGRLGIDRYHSGAATTRPPDAVKAKYFADGLTLCPWVDSQALQVAASTCGTGKRKPDQFAVAIKSKSGANCGSCTKRVGESKRIK